jgi:mannose-6-phosphate isomerase-like protein (cupin superfamily)
MRIMILFLALPLIASDPPGFEQWTSSELKGFEKKLAPKINALKVATQDLSKFGNHWTMIAHREGDGEAEVHEKVVDFFVVQTGEATLVVGGSMVGGRSMGAGEIRAPSIKDGVQKKLVPGDVVHIPANTPHQLLVQKGKQFTYFVIKVESR